MRGLRQAPAAAATVASVLQHLARLLPHANGHHNSLRTFVSEVDRLGCAAEVDAMAVSRAALCALVSHLARDELDLAAGLLVDAFSVEKDAETGLSCSHDRQRKLAAGAAALWDRLCAPELHFWALPACGARLSDVVSQDAELAGFDAMRALATQPPAAPNSSDALLSDASSASTLATKASVATNLAVRASANRLSAPGKQGREHCLRPEVWHHADPN